MEQFRIFDEINDIDEMAEFVYRELWFPEVNVELFPETVKQQIYNARHKYIRYAGGEGYYQDYFSVVFPPNESEIHVKDLVDSKGNKIDADIDYVYSFLNGGEFSSNTEFASMFSPVNMMMNQMGSIGGMSMGGYTSGGSGMMLQEYETAMMYLNDIRLTFGKTYNVRYIPGRKIMKIVPTPQTPIYGILSAYNNLKLDELYNIQTFRELAVAMTGVAWGKRMRKIKVSMPDGSSMSGDEIFASYSEELKTIVETIQAESEYFDIRIA
jgi:hypothetical protein